MSDHSTPSAPWYASIYPYADGASSDFGSARRAALKAALKINGTTADANRQWISRICLLAGVTPTQLAREASLSPSTINRFLKQEASSANLSATTMAAIMEAAECLIMEALRRNINNSDWVDNFWSEAVLEGIPSVKAVRNVAIIGSIQSGLFGDIGSIQYPTEMIYELTIPNRAPYGNENVFGFDYLTEYPGDSFSDQDVIFGTPLWNKEARVFEGERVIVHRRNSEKDIEVSLREVFFDRKGGAWLSAVAGEAEKYPPLFLGKEPLKLHSDELSVSFSVIGSYHGV